MIISLEDLDLDLVEDQVNHVGLMHQALPPLPSLLLQLVLLRP